MFSTTQFRLPGKLGRIIWAPEHEGAALLASQVFATRLDAVHYRDGKIIDERYLGSGLTTNVGVMALANDALWAAPSGASCATLALSNWHASGTGSTGAAGTDIQLGTSAGPAPASGVQTLVSAANVQIYKTVATLAYTGSLAITEWGLFTSSTLTASTGSPFTSGTATSGTTTGTTLTASSSTVRGEQQFIFKDTTAATPFYGLCTASTTSVVTVPAWYVVTTGLLSGANPVNADAYTIQPVMWDRKQFTALNVVSGDSIQFSYQLTINSGT